MLPAGTDLPGGRHIPDQHPAAAGKVWQKAEGEAVAIRVGVKGGKRAVLRFVTDAGETVESRDPTEMMLVRYSKGDRVTLMYDPSDTGTATIDLGLWTWHQPACCFPGFVLLAVLGRVLPE
jgi:Protein of unknown function (DUF3592)